RRRGRARRAPLQMRGGVLLALEPGTGPVRKTWSRPRSPVDARVERASLRLAISRVTKMKQGISMKSKTLAVRPLNVHLRPKSKAEKGFHSRAVMPQPEARVPGIPSTPAHDLKFLGGKTIADLQYQNYFVGGAPSWNPADVQAINKSLEAAMTDRN